MSKRIFAIMMIGLIGAGAAARPLSVTDAGGVPTLAMLDGLERGEWELRARNAAGEAPRRICVTDPRVLLQPRHIGQSCQRFIINDGARHIAVSYNCPDGGNGRTDIRLETPRLVQIDTQGVTEGMPFAALLEARKVGLCPAKVAGR